MVSSGYWNESRWNEVSPQSAFLCRFYAVEQRDGGWVFCYRQNSKVSYICLENRFWEGRWKKSGLPKCIPSHSSQRWMENSPWLLWISNALWTLNSLAAFQALVNDVLRNILDYNTLSLCILMTSSFSHEHGRTHRSSGWFCSGCWKTKFVKAEKWEFHDPSVSYKWNPGGGRVANSHLSKAATTASWICHFLLSFHPWIRSSRSSHWTHLH